LEERVDPWKMSRTPPAPPETLARVSESQGLSLRWRDPPTRALGIQGWSKVEKRKVEEMYLEISLPRIPGGEQENLRPR
jgi:hypothetical protein